MNIVRVYSTVCPGFQSALGVGGSWSSVHINSSSASRKCTKTRRCPKFGASDATVNL